MELLREGEYYGAMILRREGFRGGAILRDGWKGLKCSTWNTWLTFNLVDAKFLGQHPGANEAA